MTSGTRWTSRRTGSRQTTRRMHGDLRGIIEIRTDNERSDSTFRAAYTVELGAIVHVLHVFQKKARSGIETPKRDLGRIRQRLRQA